MSGFEYREGFAIRYVVRVQGSVVDVFGGNRTVEDQRLGRAWGRRLFTFRRLDDGWTADHPDLAGPYRGLFDLEWAMREMLERTR